VGTLSQATGKNAAIPDHNLSPRTVAPWGETAEKRKKIRKRKPDLTSAINVTALPRGKESKKRAPQMAASEKKNVKRKSGEKNPAHSLDDPQNGRSKRLNRSQ